jgi:glutamate---cysteine ligase / carboxylate-amine ligase
MCRSMAWHGRPVLTEGPLLEIRHGLVDQSLHSRPGVEATDGDGLDLALHDGDGTRPALHRNGSPARWHSASERCTWRIGAEEESMLLDGRRWTAAFRVEDALAVLPPELAPQVSAETHACVLELKTAPHATVRALVDELAWMRRTTEDVVGERLGLRLASAGTHPLTTPGDVRVASGPRQRLVAMEMQSLALREPTMALHVHVEVPDGEAAVRALDGLRGDAPLLIALAANSPFASGLDSGFASVRRPLFSTFPRTGMPPHFGTYANYLRLIDAIVRSGAVLNPSFVWWDFRLRPDLGTVEVRLMDAQSRSGDTGALVALVRCLVYRHAHGRPPTPVVPQLLAENCFLAARDGIRAKLLSADRPPHPVPHALGELLESCRSIADVLDCRAELEDVAVLAGDPGDRRQRRIAAHRGMTRVAAALAEEFTSAPRTMAAA